MYLFVFCSDLTHFSILGLSDFFRRLSILFFFNLYTLDCKNVDTQQAFIMNDETQQRAIQTFPEENVLS